MAPHLEVGLDHHARARPRERLLTSAPRSRKPKWRSGAARMGSSRPRCRGSQVWIETQVTPSEASRRKEASPGVRPALAHPPGHPAPEAGREARAPRRRRRRVTRATTADRAPPLGRAFEPRWRPTPPRLAPPRKENHERPAGETSGTLGCRTRPAPAPPRTPRGRRGERAPRPAPAPPRPVGPPAGSRAAMPRAARRLRPGSRAGAAPRRRTTGRPGTPAPAGPRARRADARSSGVPSAPTAGPIVRRAGAARRRAVRREPEAGRRRAGGREGSRARRHGTSRPSGQRGSPGNDDTLGPAMTLPSCRRAARAHLSVVPREPRRGRPSAAAHRVAAVALPGGPTPRARPEPRLGLGVEGARRPRSCAAAPCTSATSAARTAPS